MIHFTCLESRKEDEFQHYALFNIEPLNVGQAITLGNSLRRMLLSDLSGCAITAADFRMEADDALAYLTCEIPILHEFQSIPGLREDPIEILLHLKEIKLKPPVRPALFGSLNFEPMIGIIEATGPKIICANQIRFPFLPKDRQPEILNTNQYICTISSEEKRRFYIKLHIEMGKGYRFAYNPTMKKELSTTDFKDFPFQMDAIFLPIQRVHFRIKTIHDSYGNLKESLMFEIVTNGTITPQRALQESLKLLLDLIAPLFLNSTFSSLNKLLEQ